MGGWKGHPNVIPIIASEAGPRHAFLMPRARWSLADFVRSRNQTLGTADRVAIFDQVLDAIEFAHSQGVLHRDISPRNVLVMNDDEPPLVAVSDFGLGKSKADFPESTRSSVAALGHYDYTAPEQLARLKDASVRSDVYSLGKLLNFVMTGKDPRVIHTCDFTSICKRATAIDPEDRYPTVTALRSDFEVAKELLFGESLQRSEMTLRELLAVAPKLGWQEFHRAFVRANHRELVYYDQIEPALAHLSIPGNLEA